MEHEKHEESKETKTPVETSAFGDAKDQDEAACRCKEAQGKSITDFLKVMIDDLAFWRKKH